MTNSTVPLNVQGTQSVSTNVEIIEEIYKSTIDGLIMKSPKVRTTIIEPDKEQKDYINFEVDLQKLENQMALFKLNEDK